jgi:hypothetical protein
VLTCFRGCLFWVVLTYVDCSCILLVRLILPYTILCLPTLRDPKRWESPGAKSEVKGNFGSLLPEIAPSTALGMSPIDCHRLKLLKKHPVVKRYVKDAEAKQAVTSLRALDRNFCYAVIHVLVPRWKNCLNVIVEYVDV